MNKFFQFSLLFTLISLCFLSCEKITKYELELKAAPTEEKTAIECSGKIIKGNPKFYAEKGFLISTTKQPEYNPHKSAIIEMRTYTADFDTTVLVSTFVAKIPAPADSIYYIVSYIRSNYGLFTSAAQEISIKQK